MSSALVQQVRTEADGTKGCFTDISFKAFAICLGFLGLIFQFMQTTPEAGFAGVFVIFFCLLTSRIGTYKFTNANRNYGFQLHLSRNRDYDTGANSLSDQIIKLDWEELMFAWRMLEPTLYRQIYRTSMFGGSLIRTEAKNLDYPWFDTCLILDKIQSNGCGQTNLSQIQPQSWSRRVRYQPGTYLRSMLMNLYGLAIASLVLMVGALVLLWDAFLQGETRWFLPGTVVTIVGVVFIVFRWSVDRSARKILQHGLGSIQSTALIWRAVCLSVLQAKRDLRASNSNGTTKGHETFTALLAKHVAALVSHYENIHSWIQDQEKELSDDQRRDDAAA